MPVRIDVWSDFVCPFCYMAALSLDELRATHAIDAHWRSFELRPEGTVVPEYYAERIKASRPRIAQMMWERFGVTINPGPWGINSHRALLGAKVAEAQGEAIGDAYHREMLKAYWLEGRSIDQTDVLRDVAVRAGMDGDAFLAALDDPRYETQVQTDIALAQQIGIGGVPAMIFARKYFVEGAQPTEILREIVEQVAAESPSA